MKPLTAEDLTRRSDPARFDFTTTAELPDLDRIPGQERAVEAIRLGIGIRRKGYNLFVFGPPGTGRSSLVRQFLAEKAESDPAPSDWCYVHDFAKPYAPRAIRLPAGRGTELRNDFDRLVENLATALRAAFAADEYRLRRLTIAEEVKERQAAAFGAVDQEARARGIRLIHTPVGVAFALASEEEVLSPEKVGELPEEKRVQLERDIAALKDRLKAILLQIPAWESESRERLRELGREFALHGVGHYFTALREKYALDPDVLAHLNAVQEDVVERAGALDAVEPPEPSPLYTPEDPSAPLTATGGPSATAAVPPRFARYRVNLLVAHASDARAPVVVGELCTDAALLGRIEHIARMGTLVTDFSLIKAGLLHRANGGYLVLDAQKILREPQAWEALKRALCSERIQIESLAQPPGFPGTVSLEPEPIPLAVKVALIGPRPLHEFLTRADPEFRELFKVAVDFDDRLERTATNLSLYARVIATMVRREGLRHLERDAVEAVLERSGRWASDQRSLSASLQKVEDLLLEADHEAGAAGREIVSAADVRAALDAEVRRAGRIRERLLDETMRGTILVETRGEMIGEVNGLSTMEGGDLVFGRPVRISARVRLGAGEVVDIEREVELGGALHSKGVLILTGCLGARYCPDRPLSLRASLVFEQSYGAVEGDSASLAELCALISALAEAPVRRGLAVTGSIDQHGRVQAIGGVNEKIEGFFDLCAARGLLGDQGVLIPASNAQHLMLRDDVIDAVREGAFRIVPIATIDEAIEILTGLPAGEREPSGEYPSGSVNARVENRLAGFATAAARFAAGRGPMLAGGPR